MSLLKRRAWRLLGADGIWTLILALLVSFASAGVTLLLCLWRVFSYARRTSAYPTQIDGIVVFGNALRRGEVSPIFITRLDRALVLAHQFPQVPVIVLGGKTTAQRSEAAAGRDYLVAQGLPESRIQLEESSRYTLENLQHAKRYLIHATQPSFITSRYHLARVHDCAQSMQLPHQLVAAEDRWRSSLGNVLLVLRDAAYLHWYHVGRLWAEWTHNRRSLQRIR